MGLSLRPQARAASNRRFAAALSESLRSMGRFAVVANCAQVKAAARSFEISLRCSSFSPQNSVLWGPRLALVNALATPPLRYHLFAVDAANAARLADMQIKSIAK